MKFLCFKILVIRFNIELIIFMVRKRNKDMDYRGYTVCEEKNKISIEKIKDIDLNHTFECGQCFRWNKNEDESFTGVVKGRVVNMKFKDNVLIINNSDFEDFKSIWFEYLDLGRDYGDIKQKINKDKVMDEAIKFGHGIRILKQEVKEVLVSFIFSANNRIPRIMKSVEILSDMYGNEIKYDGKIYHSFPDLRSISESELCKMQECKAGFRCKYIIEASKLIEQGIIDMSLLIKMDTDKSRKELMKLPGVGPKVADCILLYSGTKHDVFPTDVWVKRVMEELYFKREATFKEINDFSKEYFGEYAGFAQQYLFYYARENKIGV